MGMYIYAYVYRGEIKYTCTTRKTTGGGGGPKEIYGV